MVSYIKSFYNYIFSGNSKDEVDDDKEQFLAEQIVDLELTAQKTQDVLPKPTLFIPRNAVCYERTGVVTFLEEDTGLIDGMIFFDVQECHLTLQVKDKVSYLCYKDEDEIIIVRILESFGIHWGDNEEAIEEKSFDITTHVFIGEVDYRIYREVFIKNTNFHFNLDSVCATFVPIEGDWLELFCKVKFDEDKPMTTSFDTIIQVLSMKPLRTKLKSGVVTIWNGDTGICDRQILFNKHCVIHNGPPNVGSKVLIEAIESNQGAYPWRAIKIEVTEAVMIPETRQEIADKKAIEERSLAIEKLRNIDVTYPLKIETENFYENPCIALNIKNNSNEPIVLNKWILIGRKKISQVGINPFLTKPRNIYPGHTFSLNITCQPKFFGRSKEHLVLNFRGFQVDRFIDINVISNNILGDNKSQEQVHIMRREQIVKMKDLRLNLNKTLIPGIKLIRAPNFVATKVGMFTIPDKIWDVVLGDANETVHNLDFNRFISRIEARLPCLMPTLNINNYTNKWHTLIHMEEIQTTIGMRSYDIPKGFLIRCQEYFGIEIKGLSEKRPSLIPGDRAVVNDVWDKTKPYYEGYIHLIKGDLLLVKYHPQFHETYSGSDVSIKFQFSRTIFRRAHHAVNLAIANLGADILFPNRIITRPFQIPKENVETIEWNNRSLNRGQRDAIKNILLGECRPLPYCVYGPPGTGKTITIIETILQILTLLPDSRILVATPSNSSANLVTERLVHYNQWSPNSIVRLIANYMVDSENIPDGIKPYCATVNIAREDTVKSSHEVKNGFNLNVSTSYISRHRVCIGTCYSLGTMLHLAISKGHFTHVIVDEAGQALEPEIMIPLTFIDKDIGQIILAGDPMQLGPIAMSRYCVEFGYNVSYLSRLLETFPYQRDYTTFKNGYNEKLVTRLSENYRSLEEVITLPSKMFYDSSLVPKLNRNEPWIEKILDVISDVCETTDTPKTGGIFVYGIKGCNRRAEDSPSWLNPEEAAMVALTACKLFKKNITTDDIGIVTPYIAQIKYVRVLFDAMGLPRPKIGTVEQFQGQERKIIIITTVRTSESDIPTDHKHALGFVKNPKRLNVALTRAQIAVLLFCDPHLLLTDPMWQQVINDAIQNDKYIGCDLPINYVKSKVDLNKE